MEIRIITSSENKDLEKTIIIDTLEEPVLVYNKKDLDNGNVARNDHLDFLLRGRDWNIGNRLYLGSDNKIKMSLKDFQDSPIPKDIEKEGDIDFEEDGNIEIQNSISRLYNKLIKFGDKELLDFYDIIRNANINFDENQNNIEILEKDYTSTINFNRFLASNYLLSSQTKTNISYEVNSSLMNILASNFPKGLNDKGTLKDFLNKSYDPRHLINYEISPNYFMANIIVSYTYLDRSGLKSVSEEILIKPFDKEKKKLYSKHYTRDKRVLAEVCDGVLRLFPMSPEVRECVIQSCILISEEYEKL